MTHYEAAKDGRVDLVLLTGEPGMGKTRLLDEIASRTSQNGAVVLRGEASEAEGMPPFLPFVDALSRYIRVTKEELLCKQVALVHEVLASLLPELAACFHERPVTVPFPPEQARLRLYEALGAFLAGIGAPYALVLILDDLHWADTASLDLLSYLARSRPDAHLLLLGAFRENEIAYNPALARTLSELSRQRMLTTIVVGPLSAEEIGTLAESRLGASLSNSVKGLLHTQSEGNPFFAEELLENWIETGALVQEHQEWVADSPLELTLPPSIVGALHQRFTRLSPAVIDHLRVAAIIGRSFNLSLLAMVEEQEIEAVEECLLVAVRARLVRADQAGCFHFSHDKIRECLYAEVSTSRSRRLHGIIGQILEARYGQQQTLSASQLAELAFHFARSGDQERGVHYTLHSAAQALQAAAPEEAMVQYRTTLSLLGSEDRRRGDVLLDLGEAALLAGKEQEAETLYETAQRWLRTQVESQDAVLRSARAAHGLGLALWHQEKRLEARMALEHALASFGDLRCAERVKVLLDVSQLLLLSLGHQDEGIAYAEQAHEMALGLGEMGLATAVKRIVAGNLFIQGSELSFKIQSLEDVLVHAEAHGDLAEAAACCLNLAMGYFFTAQVRRSYEVSLHRIMLLEGCRYSSHAETTPSWLVLLLASQGKWSEANRMLERIYPMVARLASPLSLALLHHCQAFLAYQREEYVIALRELEAVKIDQNLEPRLDETILYPGLLGLVQAMLGKREEASASMVRLERLLQSMPEGILPIAPLGMCLTLTAIALGDYKRARRFYKPLLAFAGQHYWFLVDRVLGLIATLCGEWEMAELHLAAAEATAECEELHPELARTLLGQAEVETRRGGQGSTQRARNLLNRALVLFRELGMAGSVHSVHRRLHALSHHSSNSTSPSLPANLTEREATVLKLVASGKSTRQIARALVLSEKTVTNHLTHIFNKTASENRAGATAFAFRHGLA
jgi:DNA-binding NarL/FixJ family response regulator